jgi:hypothetical protein
MKANSNTGNGPARLLLDERHSGGRRLHQRDEESCVNHFKLTHHTSAVRE